MKYWPILLIILLSCKNDSVQENWLPIKIKDLAFRFRNAQEPMYSAVSKRLELINSNGSDYFYYSYFNLSFTCENSNSFLIIPNKTAYLDMSEPKKCNRVNVLQDYVSQKEMTLQGLKLEQTQQKILEIAITQLMPLLKQFPSSTIGRPGSTDGGANLVKFRYNGIEKTFFIDTDLSSSQGYADVITANKILLTAISSVYESELKNLN